MKLILCISCDYRNRANFSVAVATEEFPHKPLAPRKAAPSVVGHKTLDNGVRVVARERESSVSVVSYQCCRMQLLNFRFSYSLSTFNSLLLVAVVLKPLPKRVLLTSYLLLLMLATRKTLAFALLDSWKV